VLVGAYALKALQFPTAIVEELNHPVRLSFFPTISIGAVLISMGLLEYSKLAATLTFWLGAIMQLGLTLLILNRWLHNEKFKTEHNSPAWFIPIIGNILVPIPAAQLGFTELAYFFFGIGILFWLPLLGITLNRSFFFPAMPEKLRPTLFILIAPPAVGFLSWLQMHGGKLDDFGVILYFFALFTTLMIISQAKAFWRLEFGMPFWAFTFPLAAVTIASFTFYSVIPQPHYLVIAVSLYLVTAGVVVWVSSLTLRSAIAGKLCLPEN
jgi:tellurite resistance protein